MPGTLPDGGNFFSGIVEGTMGKLAPHPAFDSRQLERLRSYLGREYDRALPALENAVRTYAIVDAGVLRDAASKIDHAAGTIPGTTTQLASTTEKQTA